MPVFTPNLTFTDHKHARETSLSPFSEENVTLNTPTPRFYAPAGEAEQPHSSRDVNDSRVTPDRSDQEHDEHAGCAHGQGLTEERHTVGNSHMQIKVSHDLRRAACTRLPIKFQDSCALGIDTDL